MKILVQTTVGLSRGTSRIWIEGRRLAAGGFAAGDSLTLTVQKGKILLRRAQKAEVDKRTYNVVERKRTKHPLLEVRADFLASLFGHGARIIIKMFNGKMSIAPSHKDSQNKSRIEDFKERLNKGDSLRVASLYHGGGVIDCAIHEGLGDTGLKSTCSIVSEIEPKYLESSLCNNEHLFNSETIVLNAPVEDLNYSSGEIPSVDLVIGGAPCVGASISGRSKNKISMPEQHKTAGAQFYSFLKIIEATKPVIVIMENVVEYMNAASYAVISSVLTSNGYKVQQRIMNGVEFGALENRSRIVMVAFISELEEFNIDEIAPESSKPESLQCILEPDDKINSTWKDYGYLRDKEVKDKAAGKGFMRQILEPSAELVPTIGRGYNKVRSTEPQLKHPTDPLLTRLFSPIEHARIKGIPERIIEGLSATTAHEILGQSVIYPAFKAVGKALGNWIRRQVSSTPALSVA